MPQKIFMTISNINNSPSILAQHAAAQAASLTPSTPALSSLNAPFIARIHNARPGCSSCGRKA